jgi:hypothetical protein
MYGKIFYKKGNSCFIVGIFVLPVIVADLVLCSRARCDTSSVSPPTLSLPPPPPPSV